jgi:hypothetical protein
MGPKAAEMEWIHGVRPGSSDVTQGEIRAVRIGLNCWMLSKVSKGKGKE